MDAQAPALADLPVYGSLPHGVYFAGVGGGGTTGGGGGGAGDQRPCCADPVVRIASLPRMASLMRLAAMLIVVTIRNTAQKITARRSHLSITEVTNTQAMKRNPIADTPTIGGRGEDGGSYGAGDPGGGGGGHICRSMRTSVLLG
jgi:hypothetical protein